MEKLKITRDMITLPDGEDTIMNLFDDNNDTNWFPGWSANYPATAIIDLKGVYKIEKLRLFDTNGAPRFIVYAGLNPFKPTKIADVIQNKYMEWHEIPVNIEAQYVILEIPNLKEVSPNALEIFGTKTSNIETPILGEITKQPSVDRVIGANSYHWIKKELQTNFNTFREYHYWEWYEQTKGKYKFEPTHSADANYDTHYKEMKDAGKVVIPCINQAPKWLSTGTGWNADSKPLSKKADGTVGSSTDPASYIDFSKMLYQKSARYGKTKVDESLLSIDVTPRWNADPINVKKTGLDLLQYIEVWNEPDKWWKGATAYFSPYEYAAMLSACYDGHEGKLGKDAGIKTADPNMKVVMGGLIGFNLDYIKAMDLWFKANRTDKKFPVDVFNFHHYSNSTGIQLGNNSVGISPEDDKFREKIVNIKSYLNKYFPNREIWLSEFGYDTNNDSTQKCPSIGSMDQKEVQGIWNVRSFLDIFYSGIDMGHIYLIDDQGSGQGLYAGCGVLTNEASGRTKKPSWYHINQMKDILTGFKFDKDLSTVSVRNYQFTKGQEIVNVLWLPTSADMKLDFVLDLAPNASNITLTKLSSNSNTGVVSTLTNNKNTVSLQVSERPVFVKSMVSTVVTPPANPNPPVEPVPTTPVDTTPDVIEPTPTTNVTQIVINVSDGVSAEFKKDNTGKLTINIKKD